MTKLTLIVEFNDNTLDFLYCYYIKESPEFHTPQRHDIKIKKTDKNKNSISGTILKIEEY